MSKFVVGLLLFLALGILIPREVFAQDTLDLSDYRAVMAQMIVEVVNLHTFGSADAGLFEQIGASGDPLYIAPLVDVGYFTFGTNLVNAAVMNALAALTGENLRGGWPEYFQWVGRNDIALPPGYAEFKGQLYATLIDDDFARFLNDDVQATARVNLGEVIWGGVAVDGIPSLVNAAQVTPEVAAAQGETLTRFCRANDCRYPAPDELVFGVSIDGDNRAYPLRILNWHEMFNDVIGFAPLYDAPDGETVCNFRAPVAFRAVARQGNDWVQMLGAAPDCNSAGGWLRAAALEWGDSSWDVVRDLLPEAPAERLTFDAGITGWVSGRSIMLAYCTLCGAGILYDPVIDDLTVNGENLGRVTLEFGSTGMLMRSNKLMYDRLTDTVWNALTGEPAFGPLADSGIRLPLLPVVVTDWESWLAEHPDTSVLSLDTGYRRDYTNGAAYGDYFNDPNFIMFPVWQQDNSTEAAKEIVFTLYLNDAPKAYPLRHLITEQVTNDSLAGIDLVIVSRETPGRDFFEPGGAAVRAYDRGAHTFSAGATPREIVDENGASWRVMESELVSTTGESLARLPGHLAFWFGWYGFYPQTAVYEPAQD